MSGLVGLSVGGWVSFLFLFCVEWDVKPQLN